jgi:hypothetical protein
MDESTKAQLPADKALVALFTDGIAAESAYLLLKDLRYAENDISVLLSDESRIRYFSDPGLRGEVIGSTITGGPGMGAAVGAGTGAVLGGMLAAAAVIAFPGISLVALGPLAAIAAGSGLGGLGGVWLGSLLGVGIPEDQAKNYEEKLRRGNILIGVSPRSDEDREIIMTEWNKLGAEMVTQKAIP